MATKTKITQTKYIWVTVGDQFVCSDCVDRESWSEKPYPVWEGHGVPRVANTLCDGRCRCELVPTTIEEIERESRELIEKFMDEIELKADLAVGRQIRLKDYEKIDGMLNAPYKTIAGMEKLIADWKIKNNFKALPKEFFIISEIDGMVKWLKGSLK
jgi:hypothetical protein